MKLKELIKNYPYKQFGIASLFTLIGSFLITTMQNGINIEKFITIVAPFSLISLFLFSFGIMVFVSPRREK